MSPSRRQLLTATLAFGTTSLAGCTDDGADPEPDDDLDEQESDDSNPETETQDQTGCDVEDPHPTYDQTEVTIRSDGEAVDSVTAAISDTGDLRYTGLSNTTCLPENRGMLFVFDTADTHPFVMREMDFPIDIVYADVDKTITDIFHAPKPGPNEDGESQEYPGFGQYVLEVNYDWTTDRGIETGDTLDFDL